MAIAPLSDAFFIDQAGAAGGDGSIAKPWNTLLAAVTARAGLGGTFMVMPYDYSAEVIPPLDGSTEWSFVGFDFAAIEVTPVFVAPAGPPCRFPALTIAASSPTLVLRSIRVQNIQQDGAGAVYVCDTQIVNGLQVASSASVLSGQRSYFGGGGIGTFDFVNLDRCGFFGSQQLFITNSLGVCRLTNCYGETGFTFGGFSPGTVFVDLYTRGQLAISVLNNCALQVLGFGPPGALPAFTTAPDLTASLSDPQAQIDQIVAAGVTLALWTDNRVP